MFFEEKEDKTKMPINKMIFKGSFYGKEFESTNPADVGKVFLQEDENGIEIYSLVRIEPIKD